MIDDSPALSPDTLAFCSEVNRVFSDKEVIADEKLSNLIIDAEKLQSILRSKIRDLKTDGAKGNHLQDLSIIEVKNNLLSEKIKKIWDLTMRYEDNSSEEKIKLITLVKGRALLYDFCVKATRLLINKLKK